VEIRADLLKVRKLSKEMGRGILWWEVGGEFLDGILIRFGFSLGRTLKLGGMFERRRSGRRRSERRIGERRRRAKEELRLDG
jgi:hypothetical protein